MNFNVLKLWERRVGATVSATDTWRRVPVSTTPRTAISPAPTAAVASQDGVVPLARCRAPSQPPEQFATALDRALMAFAFAMSDIVEPHARQLALLRATAVLQDTGEWLVTNPALEALPHPAVATATVTGVNKAMERALACPAMGLQTAHDFALEAVRAPGMAFAMP